MAITKLMNIKDTGTSDHAGHLNRLLNYMMNPDKTEETALVGVANCTPDVRLSAANSVIAPS